MSIKLLQALQDCVSVMANDLKGMAIIQPELDQAQKALADHFRPVEWDGLGMPPVGTVCEVLWNESRVEYLRTKVFGVNEHGQPIHRFDEGPKKYQYQADVLSTASGTQVFRPIRTAEQVAAEERKAGVDEMMAVFDSNFEGCRRDGIEAIWDAGYRKQVAL